MKIITDDIDFASKLYPNKNWTNKKLKDFSKTEISFLNQFYTNNNLFYSKSTSNSFLQYALLTKYANQSQFDLLNSLSKSCNNLPNGILCLADSGSNFHGYRNREWSAQSGNLHLSILKKPQIPISHFNVGFTILAAISVVQTLDLIKDLKNKAWIKWVNDIYFEDSKVAGVITQSQTTGEKINTILFGIGLNVEKTPKIISSDFVNKTTSIYANIENKEKFNIHYVFSNLVLCLQKNYDILIQEGYTKLFELYLNRAKLIGENVIIYSDPIKGKQNIIAKGKVLDIGENLELYLDSQKKPVIQGRLIFA